VHQAHKAFNEVVHVAKRAGLRAVAVEGDGLTLQRLDDEVAHHAAVFGVHARAVGVEDARDLDVYAVLAAVVEEQGFGAALAFVVARARTDRVGLAPVAFGLRMDFGVAVDLAGGCLKDLRTSALGQPPRVRQLSAQAIDLFRGDLKNVYYKRDICCG
jgi:hypothetical protein